MDPIKVQQLLELIEKASVWPPNVDELPARNQAIIDKAEAEIDKELQA